MGQNELPPSSEKPSAKRKDELEASGALTPGPRSMCALCTKGRETRSEQRDPKR